MTILEETKEMMRKFREANDFDFLKKAMNDLDVEENRSEEDNEAMDYICKNIRLHEMARII